MSAKDKLKPKLALLEEKEKQSMLEHQRAAERNRKKALAALGVVVEQIRRKSPMSASRQASTSLLMHNDQTLAGKSFARKVGKSYGEQQLECAMPVEPPRKPVRMRSRGRENTPPHEDGKLAETQAANPQQQQLNSTESDSLADLANAIRSLKPQGAERASRAAQRERPSCAAVVQTDKPSRADRGKNSGAAVEQHFPKGKCQDGGQAAGGTAARDRPRRAAALTANLQAQAESTNRPQGWHDQLRLALQGGKGGPPGTCPSSALTSHAVVFCCHESSPLEALLPITFIQAYIFVTAMRPWVHALLSSIRNSEHNM